MSLRETLSSYWEKIQGELFPFLDDAIGPLTPSHRQLVVVLEMARLEAFVRHWRGLPGRPPSERAALARAFVAKAVLNLPTTRMLIERIQADKTLRRLCGWPRSREVPSESTFSRAFAEFAASELPSRLHEALVKETQGDRLVGHVSRDATAIHGREKPEKAGKPLVAGPAENPGRKRGRPRKGEQRPNKAPRRIEKQAAGMSLAEMIPDTADGDIPISCVLTSASVHDSQAAIPLATMTAARVSSCYDLMDSAYDVPEIRSHSRSLGHVPIIDINPRRTPGLKQERAQEAKRQALVGHRMAEDVRYNERTAAERVNANLKDNHGGDTVRVRGPDKVMCHLMFGILTITATQILRLVT